MCSLIPELEGISDNIRVISIVDRYLEHDRVYIFDNAGDKRVYLSSADWMTRNIDYRIEVAAPLLDPRLKQRILGHYRDPVQRYGESTLYRQRTQ